MIQLTVNAVEEAKHLISNERNALMEILAILSSSVKPIEERKIAIRHQFDHVNDDMNTRITKMNIELERHRKILTHQIKEITHTKVESLNKQLRLVARIIDKTEHLVELMLETIESPAEHNVFSIGGLLLQQSANIKQSFDSILDSSVGMTLDKHKASLVPCEMADLAVKLRLEKVKSMLREDAVVISKTAKASKCSAGGPGLGMPVALQMTYFQINVRDALNRPCHSMQNIQVTMTLSTGGRGLLEPPRVTHNRPGVYMVSYCPHLIGDHLVNISVNDEPIQGSPFNIKVLPSLSLALKSKAFESLDGIQQPSCITKSPSGNLLIGDSAQPCKVFIVDSNGTENRRIPIRGEADVLKSITGIAVDKDSFVYVTSALENCVCKYSPAGTLLKELSGSFNAPSGIRVTLAGEVFVCDTQNSRIQVFDEELQFKRKIDLGFAYSTQITEPPRPNDIDFNAQGTMFVSDACNNCVLVFNSKECFQLAFWQFRDSELNDPRGMAIDDDGYLYICDSGM